MHITGNFSEPKMYEKPVSQNIRDFHPVLISQMMLYSVLEFAITFSVIFTNYAAVKFSLTETDLSTLY